MKLKELEAALKETRKKIDEQLSMVGKSLQSIDSTLYEKEELLEQVIAMWHVEFDISMRLKELETSLEAPRRGLDKVRQRNDAIIRACQSVDPDFVVDGKDQDQERWTVCYNYSDNLGWLPVDNFFNLYGTAWVSTEEKAKEVCALLTMWKTEELFRGDDEG